MAKRRLMKKVAFGAGLGAAVMYLFDPANGRLRRTALRERVAPKTNEPTVQSPAEPALREKIESQVLRYYPKGAINVDVEGGVVVLRGRLSRTEQINALIDDVAQVEGVQDVRSLLQLEAAPTT